MPAPHSSTKYAYASQEKGTIHVVLERQGEDHIALSVSDDGIGLPPDFDLKHSRGLGMRIVRVFASQLGGKIDVCNSRDRGAKLTLVVPLTAPV
ncbi:ATP-binding protein [Hyphomicrobium sp.]|uniref:ATP-binding protein n=1 Tax=Hyphomicrobium sp. TaxID=82 RepID=UPI0025B9336C|nr:ATP-binding protein [Hyphomicrobium sp.]